MAYFDCIVGGSGKGNTVTVTCAEEFAGLTITLAKTGKTYTKTCPSTSPYVVTFYGVENGTYTVSCTVDGQTYSETVIVQDISCVLNYGFKWQTWVDTASQLDSSDYDSLDEVLEDEKALRELFLEHACVDYMASVAASNADLETIINDDYCAKWINLSDYALDFLHANEVIAELMDEADKYGYGEWALMPQVPKMTSNTAPFGVASASSQYSDSYAPWKAFTGTITNEYDCWHAANNTTAGTIQYKFNNPICIKKMVMLNRNYNYIGSPKDFKIQGSNDGTNWTDLGSYTNTNNTASARTEYEILNNNNNYYLYIRLNITSVNSTDGSLNIGNLQFYAWAPKGNVPVMTSNTAPYGTASAINSQSGRNPYYVFDEDENTSWHSTQGTSNAWIQYSFTTPICARRVSTIYFTDASSTDLPVIIQASNDGTTWTNLKTISLSKSTTHGSFMYVDDEFENDNYYLHYRFFAARGFYSSEHEWLAIVKLQFYGRELKVSVPVMTSNTAPYGEVISSPAFDVYYSYKAFDGTNTNLNDSWLTSGNGSGTAYIGYKFKVPTKIKFVAFTTRNEASTPRVPKTMTLQGSDNGTNWVNITESGEIKTTAYTPNVSYNFEVLNNDIASYHYIRLLVETVWDTSYVGLGIVQFYGLDYSEKEFEEGTTKKWLYDHGVELETIEVSNASQITKSASSIKLVGLNANIIRCGCSIDLTQYSLMRGKYPNFTGTGHYYIVTSTLTSGGEAYTQILASTGAPNNVSVDVSSINATKYVTSQADNNTDSLEVTEMWLE